MQTERILEVKRIFNNFAYSCRTLLRGDSLVLQLQPNTRENMEFPPWQCVLDNLTLAAKRYRILGKPAGEYVSICLTHDKLRKELLQWLSHVMKDCNFEKSKSRSEAARKKGNDMFVKKHYKESLKFYSTSVKCAPFDSVELGLALGNVSAALFHLGNYEKCLEMVTAAIDHGYPNRTKYKLCKRRAECYEQLNNHNDAVTNYQIAKKAIVEFNQKEFPNHKKAPLLRDIDAALSRLASIPETTPTDQEQEEFELPVPSYGENAAFAYASSALDLVHSEEKGRYVKTNRDVKQGDILFVEKPYTFIILPGYEDERCHHCFKPILSVFPCLNCVDVSYCSEDCKKKSWEEVHQWECFGAVKLFMQVGIAHLGLRVLLKTGDVKMVKQKYKRAKSDQNMMTCGKIEKYGDKEDNYSAVYHLLPQINEMNAEDSFQYALTASLLTLYLHEYTNYFHEKGKKLSGDNIDNCDKRKNVIFIGELIYRHIAQLVCNAHAILEIHCLEKATRVLEERQVRIATAIYPSASMMNHSCDPRIFTSFFNDWLVVRACRDIPKGEEVFNCYGPHYRRMNVQQRQEVLQQQYFFTCKCEPCIEPKKYEYQKRFSGLLCSKCSGPLVEEHDYSEETPRAGETHEIVCLDCGHKELRSNFVEKLFKALNFVKTGEMLYDEGDYRGALRMFTDAFKLRQECMYKHNDELMHLADRLALCYQALGDSKSGIQYLEISIAGVEEKFGSTSVELGNELQKLTDLMVQNCSPPVDITQYSSAREMFQEAYSALDKTETILSLNYGPWHERVREIKYKRKTLEEMEKQYFEEEHFQQVSNSHRNHL